LEQEYTLFKLFKRPTKLLLVKRDEFLEMTKTSVRNFRYFKYFEEYCKNSSLYYQKVNNLEWFCIKLDNRRANFKKGA